MVALPAIYDLVSNQVRQCDFPFSLTVIDGCLGSSLVTFTVSLNVPAACGEKVIVTGSLVFGASVNGPPPVSENGAPIVGGATLPCNGPLPLLRTVIVLVAIALGFASRWTS